MSFAVGLNLKKSYLKRKEEKMRNNPNIGCVIVPLVLITFGGLYLLSTYVDKSVQLPIGFVFAVVLGAVAIFARLFRVNVSKR